MLSPIVYCDRCGKLVPPGQFEGGEAIETMAGAVCASCVREISPAERAGLAPPRAQTAKPRGTRTGARRVKDPAGATPEGGAMPSATLIAVGGTFVGVFVGIVVVLLLRGGGDGQSPSAALPKMPTGSAPPIVAPTVAPITPTVPVRSQARARLDSIRARIDPSLGLYAEIRTELVAFEAKHGGAPEVEEAKGLLVEIDAKFAAIADEAVKAATAQADTMAAQGRHADAGSTFRALIPRFAESEWYRTRGQKEIAAALAKYEGALVLQATEALARARTAVEEGRFEAAGREVSARWGWPPEQRRLGDEVLMEIRRKREEFDNGKPEERVNEPGLVAYWRFDEGEGSAGADSSGNRHTARFHGSVTWVEGKRKGAIAFDGEKSFAIAPQSELLNLNNKSFTIALWADHGAGPHLIAKGKGSWQGWLLGGGTFVAADRTHNLGAVRVAPVKDGQWVHLAVTYDAGTNTMTGFRDGVAVATTSPESQGAGLNNINEGSPVTLGARQGGVYGAYYSGRLDEVRIYTRALAAEEVQALCKNANSGGQ